MSCLKSFLVNYHPGGISSMLFIEFLDLNCLTTHTIG